MSKIITNRTIAAAFGAAALFTMMSLGGSAQASSVLSCQGATAGKAASCCEHMIEENGKPYWMKQSGMSCREAVVCRGGGLMIGAKSASRCHIRVVDIVKEGGGNEGNGGQSTQAE